MPDDHRQCVLLGRFSGNSGQDPGGFSTATTPFRATCGRIMPSARTGFGDPCAAASPPAASTWPISTGRGNTGLISPRPEKAIEVYRYGAEKGYPSYLFYYANELYDQGDKEDAFEFYRRAAGAGEPRAFWAGYSYELGDGVPKDNARATQYYQQALSAPIQGKVNPANRLGMCYYDGRGVEHDYAKAFQLLKWAENNGSPAMLLLPGACYANGQGTRQDYARAFTYLDRVDWELPLRRFIFSERCTATAWGFRRTSPKAWNTSRRPAIM